MGMRVRGKCCKRRVSLSNDSAHSWGRIKAPIPCCAFYSSAPSLSMRLQLPFAYHSASVCVFFVSVCVCECMGVEILRHVTAGGPMPMG